MPDKFVEKYKQSPAGLLYVAPTGSGKTRKAIAATKGGDTSVVGTASLSKNFEKEEQKAFGTKTKRFVTTYAGMARSKVLPGGQSLILDESHYVRNPQTKAFSHIARDRSKYHKALLLTGTPIVNEPYDIAPQVDLVAQKQIVPLDKKKFYQTFYKEDSPSIGMIAKLLGVSRPYSRKLKDPHQVKRTLDPYVEVENPKNVEKLLPERKEEVVKVPLSDKQQELYKYVAGKLPYSLKYKIKRQLPPSKQEAQSLNAYLSGLRQISNTTKEYQSSGTPDEPKLDKMFDDLKKEVSHKGKVIVYSNFLNSGVSEIADKLTKSKIPYSHITGSTSKPERQRQIDEYNKNKKRVMLFSGAGSEGINLPNTSLVQITEPHWNMARLYQASSRGIRRDSKRKDVKVKTYLSTFPDKYFTLFGKKLFKRSKQTSADEYLYGLSQSKEQESKTFLSALMNKDGEK